MSLVVGIKCKDGVIVGSDSIIIINEDRKEQVECASNAKIWNPLVYPVPAISNNGILIPQAPKRCDKIIMGGVGTVRDSNVLKTQLILPEVINDAVVVDKVIPEIRSVLITNGFLADTKPYDSMESSFILATIDQLFLIAQDYSMVEKKNIVVIGYCENEAKNIIRQLVKDDNIDELSFEDAKTIITEVITNCSLSCTYVGLPVQFKYLTKN